MNFTFVALKYNQPAAARRCQVVLDNIKTADTKNIGQGLFYPQIQQNQDITEKKSRNLAQCYFTAVKLL